MGRTASDILSRLCLEKLGNKVLWGREERGETDPRSYEERLNQARNRAVERITSAVENPGENAVDSVIEEVWALLDTAEDVYTTIGIQVGAELAGQKIQHERRSKGNKSPDDGEEEIPAAQEGAEGSATFFHFEPFDENERVYHSSDFCTRMESRVNLQSLGTFIRDGGTRIKFYQKPFHERLI